MIYVLSSNEMPNIVKIGYTSRNPKDRLMAVQTGFPYRLHIAATCIGSMEEESALHGFLAENRLNGEWFTKSKKICDFMDLCHKYGKYNSGLVEMLIENYNEELQEAA